MVAVSKNIHTRRPSRVLPLVVQYRPIPTPIPKANVLSNLWHMTTTDLTSRAHHLILVRYSYNVYQTRTANSCSSSERTLRAEGAHILSVRPQGIHSLVQKADTDDYIFPARTLGVDMTAEVKHTYPTGIEGSYFGVLPPHAYIKPQDLHPVESLTTRYDKPRPFSGRYGLPLSINILTFDSHNSSIKHQ